MGLMAQKLDASLALEGQFSAEGLAAMSADSGSLTMELAKSLVENIDFGDAERAWEKLSAVATRSGHRPRRRRRGRFLPLGAGCRKGSWLPAQRLRDRRSRVEDHDRAAIRPVLTTPSPET